MKSTAVKTTLGGLLTGAILLFGQASFAAPMSDPVPTPSDPLATARGLLKDKNWSAASRELTSVVRKEPRNAEAHNLLGYSLRNSGDFVRAKASYDEALRLDPKHIGAHEYLGQLYLRTNQPELAKQHLAQLEALCGKACDEYRSLEKAISGQ